MDNTIHIHYDGISSQLALSSLLALGFQDDPKPLTIQIIHLEPIRILPFISDWNLDDLSARVTNLCRRLLDNARDDLGVLFRQPSEEGGNTLGGGTESAAASASTSSSASGAREEQGVGSLLAEQRS